MNSRPEDDAFDRSNMAGQSLGQLPDQSAGQLLDRSTNRVSQQLPDATQEFQERDRSANRDTRPGSNHVHDTATFELDTVSRSSGIDPDATANYEGGSATRSIDSGATWSMDPSGENSPDGSLPNSSGRRGLKIEGYELLGELGRGAMGVVYKARQIHADRMVALKVMINVDHAQPKEIERFSIEAQASARLQHPNIVQVYHVGQTGSLPFFTQEFVPGGTLASRIARQSLSHAQAAEWMLVLAKAVAYAHSRGVIHRDLKPSNILMDERDTLKIADFGLARRMDDESHLTKDGTILGTPAYMAPEQAYGSSAEIGPLSDVYTLGAILYELLVGRPPFKGATSWEVIEQVRSAEPVRPTEIERSIPRDLETICLKCLNKDPAKRYESAQALADDLQRSINFEPILARPIGRIERLSRLCRRHPGEARLVGFIALLLLLATGGSIWTALRISRDRNRILHEQELSSQRLKSRNQTIFQLVNRAPQKLESVPFARAASEELSLLIQEVLESEAESLKNDSAADVSRKWGLVGAALGSGRLAQTRYTQALSGGPNTPDLDALYEEVAQNYRTAVQFATEVYDSGQGDRAKAAGNLALALTTLANLYATSGRGDDPRALMLRAVELRKAAILEPVIEDTLAKRQHALARSEADLIEVEFFLMKQMDNSETQTVEANRLAEHAQSVCSRMQEILKDESIPEDDRRVAKRDLVVAASHLVEIAEFKKYGPLIEYACELAIATQRELITIDPLNVRFQWNLLHLANRFGDYWLVQQQDAAKARAQYVTAMTVIRDLKKDGVLINLDEEWFMEYYRLGIAAHLSQNAEQTRRYFERAVLICDIQLRQMEDVKSEADSPKVWFKRSMLMLAQAWAGQVEPAASMARRIVARCQSSTPLVDKPETLARAAFALGLAALHVPESSRAAAQAEALSTMRAAITAGYKDFDYLRSDPDVSGLRAIPEFESILQK